MATSGRHNAPALTCPALPPKPFGKEGPHVRARSPAQTRKKEEKGYTLPEYAFTVECDGVESEESGQLDVKDEIVLTIKNFDELKGKTLKLVWKDGNIKEIPIDSEKLKISDIFIGSACMLIK